MLPPDGSLSAGLLTTQASYAKALPVQAVTWSKSH